MVLKLVFIGFGVVGQGLAEILVESSENLKNKYNFEYSVVAISDTQKGSIYNPEGLDLNQILDIMKTSGNLTDYKGTVERGWDSLSTIKNANADVITQNGRGICELGTG